MRSVPSYCGRRAEQQNKIKDVVYFYAKLTQRFDPAAACCCYSAVASCFVFKVKVVFVDAGFTSGFGFAL